MLLVLFRLPRLNPLTATRPCLCFQDLSCLIERYLTPLQKESFLTQDEVLSSPSSRSRLELCYMTVLRRS